GYGRSRRRIIARSDGARLNRSLAGALAEEAPMLHFAGHAFESLPSGGLYWPERDTLLVADLHFEKLASFAAHGQLLPPYDTGLTLARLEADLSVTKASRLVA